MKYLPKYLFTLSLAALISACGGSGSSNGNVSDASTDSSNKITIYGSVGDGPIVGATVTLKSHNGSVLSTTTSSQLASYTLSVEVEPDDYPLLLEASHGIDLVTGSIPDFTLLSVVPNPTVTHANLNPHSTLIVMTTRLMSDGITENNLEEARKTIIAELNFGLDTDLINDPITAKIDSSNLPSIVYASEALGEMIRRSSAALGDQASVQAMLNSLASDLIDGVLDGKGSVDINSLHTTVSQAVSLQVLLESMLHDLKVNGILAEKKLTDAITTVLGASNKSTQPFRSNKIKWPMLKQTRAALNAIQEVDQSITFLSLMRVLEDLGEYATTDQIIAALKQLGLDLSISNSIESSIAQVANLTEESIEAIGNSTNPGENNTVVTSNSSDTVPDNPTIHQDSTTINTDNAIDPSAASGVNSPDPVVIPANNTPVISGMPLTTVAEGVNYLFTATVVDPDGDNLAFSITNLPQWASFDSTNGTLSGTPDYNAAGLYENIILTVSDGAANATLASFNIQVTNTNLPPIISGDPSISVAAGETYLFSPQASDPDNDTLNFNVTNLPSWANFDNGTGRLSGAPDTTDVGLYEDIVISVSDGIASTSFKIINISVTSNTAPTGIADLSWETPTTRADGGPLALSEIDGYRIYMGQTHDALSMILDLNDRGITNYSFADLPSGTYYFSVTTYDVEGNESAFSNIAEKTIP